MVVKVNDSTLRGTITQVKPAVKDGVIGFVVQLDNARSESLRPNMKVDVYVVTDRRANTLRVTNGPAFTGKRKQYVYVVQKETSHPAGGRGRSVEF